MSKSATQITTKKHDVKIENWTSSDFEVTVREPRILFIDIETFAHLAWVWGYFDQNVIAYKERGYMLCFGYKWLGEKKTTVKSLRHYKGYKGGDSTERQLLEDLWELLDEADIVIAHNGRAFDVRMINYRFIKHRMLSPSYYRVIDTKLEAKKVARFPSNKLDELGDDMEIGRKLPHQGFSLWLGCDAGDDKSWSIMERYNKQDINLLEKWYLELRPWIEQHPNLNVVMNRDTGCSKCGAPRSSMRKRGVRWTNMSVAQRYQCNHCGGYTQGKYVKVSTERSG